MLKRIVFISMIALIIAGATIKVPEEIKIVVYNKLPTETWLTLETDSTIDTLIVDSLKIDSISTKPGRYRYTVWNLGFYGLWPIDQGVYNFGADCTLYVWYDYIKRLYQTKWK